MNYLKSKTVLFNLLLALVASVNYFIPLVPSYAVTPLLWFIAISGTVLRVLTTLPLSSK